VSVVAQTTNSGETIKEIEKHKPDLLILDIRMPEGSGINVLKYIKKNKTKIITIVVTNYPIVQYKDKCFELGADYFLVRQRNLMKYLNWLRNWQITKVNNMEPGAKPNILVADDEVTNLHLLKTILKALDVNLIVAKSGLEALSKIQDQEIALALLDICMPGMDGVELVKIIQNDKSREKVPINFLL